MGLKNYTHKFSPFVALERSKYAFALRISSSISLSAKLGFGSSKISILAVIWRYKQELVIVKDGSSPLQMMELCCNHDCSVTIATLCTASLWETCKDCLLALRGARRKGSKEREDNIDSGQVLQKSKEMSFFDVASCDFIFYQWSNGVGLNLVTRQSRIVTIHNMELEIPKRISKIFHSLIGLNKFACWFWHCFR